MHEGKKFLVLHSQAYFFLRPVPLEGGGAMSEDFAQQEVDAMELFDEEDESPEKPLPATQFSVFFHLRIVGKPLMPLPLLTIVPGLDYEGSKRPMITLEPGMKIADSLNGPEAYNYTHERLVLATNAWEVGVASVNRTLTTSQAD